MSTELQKISYTQDQVALIKSQIAPKATDDELKLFLYYCRRTGLDALSKQIYAIHRWNSLHQREVMTIQTSIDGYRVVAERSKEYAGQDEPIFTYDANGNIESAKVTVYRWRGETRYPAGVAVAYYTEYVPIDKNGRPMGLWQKMPRVMIAKVAEALALRKAFPQDLGGIYIEEEMHQDMGAKVDETFDEVGDENRDYLHKLLNTSTYEHPIQSRLAVKVNSITKLPDFEKAKADLLANQAGIDGAHNISEKEVTKHIKKITTV